ncbi:unnamed protein product [Cunninghamella blakesleeana]
MGPFYILELIYYSWNYTGRFNNDIQQLVRLTNNLHSRTFLIDEILKRRVPFHHHELKHPGCMTVLEVYML